MSRAQSEVTKEQLSEEFHTVVTETQQLLASLAGAGNEKADALKASLAESLADAGERLAKIRDQAVSGACASARATDDYVKAQPWRAIGIAAGVAALAGLVAGLVIARR
jgi:ElaB/YqjD/DUF883 family membrane-anchored ribosome-binding protein